VGFVVDAIGNRVESLSQNLRATHSVETCKRLHCDDSLYSRLNVRLGANQIEQQLHSAPIEEHLRLVLGDTRVLDCLADDNARVPANLRAFVLKLSLHNLLDR